MKKLSTALILMLTAGNTLAQQSEQTQDIIDMNEVVVTATRTPTMLKDVPVLTRVINASTIEKTGASTIQELLTTELAGVEFNQAGYGTTLSFQGLDSRYVLFLVDGERLAGETYGNIDYSRIPLDNIDRIEIVKGASSVLYGSNAMGAVINIITKNPVNKFEGGGSIRYSGYNHKDNIAKPDGSLSQEIRDNADKYRRKMDVPNLQANAYFGVNLGRFKSMTDIGYKGVDAYMMRSSKYQTRTYKNGGVKTAIPLYGRPEITDLPAGYQETDSTYSALSISGWQMFNINQKFSYQFSDKVWADIAASYFWKNRYDFWGTDGGIPNDWGAAGDPWTFEHYSSCDLNAKLNYRINDRNFLVFSLLTDIYRRSVDTLGHQTPKQRHMFLVPRVLWTNTPDDKNRITVGAEISREALKFDLNPEGYDKEKTYHILSIYAQEEWQATKDLGIVVGLRFDSWGFTNINEAITNFVGKPGKSNHPGRGLAATPKLALTYKVNEFTFRANYAQGFRSPSLKELYMDYYQPTMQYTILGNDQLKPEKNNYFSLSAEYTNTVFNTSVNGYINRFKNKIDVYQNDEDKTLKYHNTDKSRFIGVEWMGRLKIIKGWWIKANCSYVHEKKEASASNTMTQYIYTSPHTAVLQTDYSYAYRQWRFNLNVSGRYIGPKEYDDRVPYVKKRTEADVPSGYPSAAPPFYVIEGTYTTKLPGYTMWNTALNITFDRHYTLTLGVDNLFDYVPKIVGFNSAMTPGRIGYVKAAVNF